MATNTYGLTSEARVKAKLGITVSSFDTVIKQYIYAVTDFIERECGRRFKRATYTQEVYNGANLDGSSKAWLVVKNAPVISISAFQYRTGAKSNPVWVDYQADDYQEMLDRGIIRAPLPSGYQNIRISYVGGYLIDFSNDYDDTLHTLPYNLSDLAERLVIKMFKRRESEGRSSESFQQSSITWKELLDDFDKSVIASYSRGEFV